MAPYANANALFLLVLLNYAAIRVIGFLENSRLFREDLSRNYISHEFLVLNAHATSCHKQVTLHADHQGSVPLYNMEKHYQSNFFLGRFQTTELRSSTKVNCTK